MKTQYTHTHILLTIGNTKVTNPLRVISLHLAYFSVKYTGFD